MTEVKIKGIMIIDNKLYRAVEQSDWNKVRDILKDPEGRMLAKKREGNGSISLHLAIFNEAPDEIIEELIDANPKSVKRKSKKNKWLPLHIAVCYGASSCVVEKLIWMYPEALEERDYIDRTPRDYLYLKNLDKRGDVLVSSFKRIQEKKGKKEIKSENEFHEKQNMMIVTNSSSISDVSPIIPCNDKTDIPSDKSAPKAKTKKCKKAAKSYAVEEEQLNGKENMIQENDRFLEIERLGPPSSNDETDLKSQKSFDHLLYCDNQMSDDHACDNSIEQCSPKSIASKPSVASKELFVMEEESNNLQDEINELDKVVTSYAEQLFKFKCFNSVLQQENHELRQNLRKLEGNLVRMEHKQKFMTPGNGNTPASSSNNSGKVRSLFLRPCL